MAIVAPILMTDDPQTYRAQVEKLHALVKRAQIVVSDGELTEQHTVPLDAVWWPKNWEVDIYLMVSNPSKYLATLTQIHPATVILSAEANEELLPLVQKLKQANIKVGLAIPKSLYPGSAENLIKIVDHVLILAGGYGQQEGETDLLQIEKVPILRGLKHSLEVGFVGGIKLENIREIAHADVDVVYVGQSVFKMTDPVAAYKALTEEADQKGVRL